MQYEGPILIMCENPLQMSQINPVNTTYLETGFYPDEMVRISHLNWGWIGSKLFVNCFICKLFLKHFIDLMTKLLLNH